MILKLVVCTLPFSCMAQIPISESFSESFSDWFNSIVILRMILRMILKLKIAIELRPSLLSNSQAGADKTVREEQEEIYRNHLQPYK